MTESFDQQPVVVIPDGGDKMRIGEGTFIHKVKSSATNNVFSIVEIVTPPGKGIDLHVHENEDEFVHLLEGEIEVTLGDQKMTAVPGVMALLPRGIPHGFVNTGDRDCRLVVAILPGDFDNYFVEMAQLFSNGSPSESEINRLSEKYSVRYV